MMICWNNVLYPFSEETHKQCAGIAFWIQNLVHVFTLCVFVCVCVRASVCVCVCVCVCVVEACRAVKVCSLTCLVIINTPLFARRVCKRVNLQRAGSCTCPAPPVMTASLTEGDCEGETWQRKRPLVYVFSKHYTVLYKHHTSDNITRSNLLDIWQS